MKLIFTVFMLVSGNPETVSVELRHLEGTSERACRTAAVQARPEPGRIVARLAQFGQITRTKMECKG